ncbi:hypothetical protein ACO22_01701 [Paracoccidioides brasiliensis]|uniref:Hemerythrin-like domain-containing protein n=1 Tax=Paracoccidioides brasiliensis TaxID=121759 RepID=A0A1D2JL00_PARBR|nr:hypothetical protein ACO22_01701 [Paracoccidioides brasiliensis]
MGYLSELVKKDHRELVLFHNQIVNADNDIDKSRFQHQFVWELARYAVAEELLFYPAIEKHLADGKERTENDRMEHKKTKDQLMEFESMKPTDPNFEPTINSIMNNLSSPIKEGEDDNLTALESAISIEDDEELSESFKRTKMFIPTLTHPAAKPPNPLPFESPIGLLTTPIDKLGDMFRRLPPHRRH